MKSTKKFQNIYLRVSKIAKYYSPPNMVGAKLTKLVDLI